MWMVFHRNAQPKLVPGGASLMHECPMCTRRTRFAEVQVDLVAVPDRKHALRCTECGEIYGVTN